MLDLESPFRRFEGGSSFMFSDIANESNPMTLDFQDPETGMWVQAEVRVPTLCKLTVLLKLPTQKVPGTHG